MHSTVKLDLSKLIDIKSALLKYKKVQIGVFSDKNGREDSLSNATIGAKHEFGVAAENLPKRSFLWDPLNEKMPEAIKKNEKAIFEAIESGDIDGLLKKLGIKSEAIIQEAFDTGGFGEWPKLAYETVEKKGFDTILVETTQLRKAVGSRLKKGGEE